MNPLIPLGFGVGVGVLSFGWAYKKEKERTGSIWSRFSNPPTPSSSTNPLDHFYALPAHQQTMSVLIAINALVFAGHRIFPYQTATHFIHYPPARKVTTLLTSVFSHATLPHFLFNMFALWSFGGFLHQVLGREYFLALYLTSGGMSSVCSHMVSHVTRSFHGSLGASGAIYGLAGYMYTAFPNAGLLLFFVIPAEVQVLIPGLAVFDTLGALGLFRKLGWNLRFDHVGHLGGLASGYLLSQTVLHPRTGKSLRQRIDKQATSWRHSFQQLLSL